MIHIDAIEALLPELATHDAPAYLEFVGELLNHFAGNDIVSAIEGLIEQENDVRTLH